MSAKRLVPHDILLAAAVVFGRGDSVTEMEFRIDAYEKLLDLSKQYGDDIEEFDVVRALEEIPGFRPRDEMRRIANELGILQRHGNALLRIKPELYLDDILPGDQPARVCSVPTDFTRAIGIDRTSQRSEATDVLGTIRSALAGLPKILEAAERSPLNLVTPFYRPNKVANAIQLSFTGTGPATTPFLSLYQAAEEAAGLLGGDALPIWEEIRQHSRRFIDAYVELVLANDSKGDSGTLVVVDDDDYPACTKPTTLSNASLISVLVSDARARRTFGDESLTENLLAVKQLADFVVRMQNDDGGWPVYRFPQEIAGTRFAASPSIPLFSLVAFAGILDASEVVIDSSKREIEIAGLRYKEWIVNTATSPSASEIAWLDDYGRPSVYETAVNIVGCLLVPVLLPDSLDELDSLISRGMRFVDKNWMVGSDARANAHEITLRPPTDSGAALVSIQWFNAGHARLVRALSLASLRRSIFPGFRGVLEMNKAVELICKDCRDGFWMHLSDPEVINVSTTVQYLQSLVAYHCAIEKWRQG